MFCPFQAKICPVSNVWVSELAGPLDQSLQCIYFLSPFLFKICSSEQLLCSNNVPSVCIYFFRCGNACWSIRCNLSTPAFSPSHHWLGRSIFCSNSSSYHLTSCSSSILLSFHTLIYQFFPMCRVFETLFCCSYPHTSVNTTWHQLIHPLQYAYFPPKRTSLTSICPVPVHKVGH